MFTVSQITWVFDLVCLFLFRNIPTFSVCILKQTLRHCIKLVTLKRLLNTRNTLSAKKVDNKINSCEISKYLWSRLHQIENSKTREQTVYIQMRQLPMSHLIWNSTTFCSRVLSLEKSEISILSPAAAWVFLLDLYHVLLF